MTETRIDAVERSVVELKSHSNFFQRHFIPDFNRKCEETSNRISKIEDNMNGPLAKELTEIKISLGVMVQHDKKISQELKLVVAGLAVMIITLVSDVVLKVL